MPESSLQTFLTAIVSEALRAPISGAVSKALRINLADATLVNDPAALKIVEQLLKDALASGLPLSHASGEIKALAGGNTAQAVARLTLHAPFVFKLDARQRKLAEEAETMRAIKNDRTLPQRFRDAWPAVYAIRGESPYAYLMELFPSEDGWQSLEDRLYPQRDGWPPADAEALRLLQPILDVLFEGYEASRNVRSLPNLAEDYVGRIAGRLEEAASADHRFAAQQLMINGVRFEAWRHYLDLIMAHPEYIAAITPPFSTVTHGDPNPGNLMLRTTLSGVELKLIDPKDWQTGDYLFDIAKITHFIEGTGPIEKPAPGATLHSVYAGESGTASLDYSFGVPSWTLLLAEACLSRSGHFATMYGDLHWRARYELAMASNLLGLPIGRLRGRNPRPEAALALYGEGLKWLARFCERLAPDGSGVRPIIVTASHAELEPEPIRRARDMVLAAAPGAREGQDRRGFQLVEWLPSRKNKAAKLCQLSLEHEARLRPDSDRSLACLQGRLGESEGRQVREVLLPEGSPFDALIVRRYPRDVGAQSVDRYYELSGVDPGQTLIPRMLSLRERRQASNFMTWSTEPGETSSLNLELPIVALGENGVVARLEFNWMDALERSIRDFLGSTPANPDARNPLYLASLIEPIERAPLEPLIEHSTFREKYGLYVPGEEAETELYQLNIDHIVVQSLKTSRIGTHTDIDIAPVGLMTSERLDALIALTKALSRRYRLEPVGASKVWRDAAVLGELG